MKKIVLIIVIVLIAVGAFLRSQVVSERTPMLCHGEIRFVHTTPSGKVSMGEYDTNISFVIEKHSSFFVDEYYKVFYSHGRDIITLNTYKHDLKSISQPGHIVSNNEMIFHDLTDESGHYNYTRIIVNRVSKQVEILSNIKRNNRRIERNFVGTCSIVKDVL